jgi:membrane peptidoglycan carboxypeptidase
VKPPANGNRPPGPNGAPAGQPSGHSPNKPGSGPPRGPRSQPARPPAGGTRSTPGQTGAVPATGSSTGAVRPTGNPTGAVRPNPNHTGAVRPTANPTGAVPATGSSTGAVRATGSSTGAVRPNPNHTGAVRPTANPTGAVPATGSPTGAVRATGNPTGAVRPNPNHTGAVRPTANPTGAVRATGSPTGAVRATGSPTGAVRATSTSATRAVTESATGARRSVDSSSRTDLPARGGSLDGPANATAARLLAEGRARMAEPEGEKAEPPVRRRRRLREFDPASLAALPAEMRLRFLASRKRHKARLAAMTPKQRLNHRLRVAAAALVGTFVVFPALVFFVGYVCFSIPSPDDAVNKQIATINFTDGSQLAKVVPAEGNRIKVDIDQVPPVVQHAVLSAEDRSFLSNPGFDFWGIARAAFKQLTGRAGGGSTITQQYVKKTLVGDEHSLWRKYKELIIAVKISQQNTKPQILGNYLNAIYFGRGAYGIQAASQAYFKTDVSKLNAEQGAVLAGVIQSPSANDPAVNRIRAVQRWTYVMDGMVRMGWLPERERAAAQYPVTIPPAKTSGGVPSDYRGLILRAVRDELEQRGITEQQFNQEGLTVTTTIDPVAQQAAVDAVHAGLAGQPDNLRSAMVSIDPTTGAILAYFGGDNGVGLNYATVRKQPGSTFKPFVLLADLLRPDSKGLGAKYKGMPIPGLRNADGASCEMCDLKQAMTISNNVIYHQLGIEVGPQNVAAAANRAGITAPLANPDAGIALGDKEVTPVDLASAYATIAAGGVYHRPHLVTKVTTSDDRVIYQQVDSGERRFDPQVIRNLIEAMLGVPTYDKMTLTSSRPVAAKTGTVQSHIENQNNDAWTAGFTPQVANVVWVGTDQNTPIKTAKGDPISGGTVPAKMWKSYMYDYTKGQPVKSFGPFKAIGSPPTVTGPNDGFMAGPPPSSDSAAADGTSSPPTTTLSQPDDANSLPSSGRVCDDQGCHDVGGSSRGDNDRSDDGRSNDDGDDDG